MEERRDRWSSHARGFDALRDFFAALGVTFNPWLVVLGSSGGSGSPPETHNNRFVKVADFALPSWNARKKKNSVHGNSARFAIVQDDRLNCTL